MAEQYLRQSPLAHLHLVARAGEQIPDAGVRMGERPFHQQWVLRGDAADDQFVQAVPAAAGPYLPLLPNTVQTKDDTSILWLGPDEWLVISPDEATTGNKLIAATEGLHSAVSDVSESRTIISVSGDRARDLLAKGCALDLHPHSFAIDACAQTLLAHVHVILHLRADDPLFDIYVHRSFAEHLWCWLEDAALEYGLAITTPD